VDLTRGRRLYACPTLARDRAAFPGRPLSLARWSRREGSPGQIRRGPVTSPEFRGPVFALRASRPALEASRAGAWLSRPSRRRERPPGAALKT